MKLSVQAVQRGKLEALLRTLRGRYYQNTTTSRSRLLTQLFKSNFEDHGTLQGYIDYVNNIGARLADIGKELGDEEKAYHLLRVLPEDYLVPRSHLEAIEAGYNKCVRHLLDYALRHPQVRGSGAKGGRSKQPKVAFPTHTGHNEVALCRNHQRGRCKNGSRCRFRHEEPPANHNNNNNNNGYMYNNNNNNNDNRGKTDQRQQAE